MILNFLNIGAAEMLLFVAPVMVIGIYTLYQCVNNPNLSSTQRIVWLIVILSVPLFGCLGYLLTYKSTKHGNSIKNKTKSYNTTLF